MTLARISVQGLTAAFLVVMLLLGVGTVSYKHGISAGKYDAQHDVWNAGYRDGFEEASKLAPKRVMIFVDQLKSNCSNEQTLEYYKNLAREGVFPETRHVR